MHGGEKSEIVIMMGGYNTENWGKSENSNSGPTKGATEEMQVLIVINVDWAALGLEFTMDGLYNRCGRWKAIEAKKNVWSVKQALDRDNKCNQN